MMALVIVNICALQRNTPARINGDAQTMRQTDSPVSTWMLGKVFNAAFVQLNGALVLAYNTDVKRVPSGLTFSCTSEHYIHITAMNSSHLPTSAHSRAIWNVLAGQESLLNLVFPAQLRDRPCQDRRNFRGNGPEDARIVQLGARRCAVLYNDYARCVPADVDCVRSPLAPSGKSQLNLSAFRRTMYVREVYIGVETDGVLDVRVSASQLVRPDSTGPAIATVEKNWAPFTLWMPTGPEPSKLYFHRFLELRGRAIVQRLDLATGFIDATYSSSIGRMRTLIRCLPHATISGGTNGVRLNVTHFIAIGHTMTAPCRLQPRSHDARPHVLCEPQSRGRRAYALFACTRKFSRLNEERHRSLICLSLPSPAPDPA